MNPNESSAVNAERAQSLLGGEHLRRLVERLRSRMSRGQDLTGKIQISGATPDERAAIDGLMGREPTQGSSLSVDLDKLARILARAKVCERLEEAVRTVVGPVIDERKSSLAQEARWNELWSGWLRRIEGDSAALQWVDELRAGGMLRRIAGSDIGTADALLRQAIAIVEGVPFPSIRLAELAASKTGDSHALDRGKPLAAMVIRFARQLEAGARWQTTAERRDAWEILGVLCDELSAPLLVLNLRADTESLTGQALNLHAVAGEPYRVSIRQLRRHPPAFSTARTGPVVYVCENPTVVDVAANKLGSSCRPLICIDGQPKTASRLLLDSLRSEGIALRYHGDFDWDGIQIANTIIRRHGATSWRFNTSDYAVACKAEHRLKGTPVSASWDAELANLMSQTGKCVHEENVLIALLTDLEQDS
jgi:uncharacterized protein (TIGR02679 family)